MKAGSRFYLLLHIAWTLRIFVLGEYNWLSIGVYVVTFAVFVVLGYTD